MYFKLFILFFAFSSVQTQLIKSLNSSLEYGIQGGVRDYNFILGVVIAKGQLELIDRNITEKHLQPVIKSLMKKCDTLIEGFLNHSSEMDPLIPLFRPELWTSDSPKSNKLHPPLSPTSIQAAPLNETMSDTCLGLLIPECRTTEKCILAEITDNAVGYETTHQVAYWTLFSQNCRKEVNSTVIRKIIKHKCEMILQEYQLIEQMGIPPQYRDLYFEQKIMCGINGFTVFLTESFIIDMISSLQLPHGCFSIYKLSEQRRRNCNLHMSATAIGVMGLMIKQQLCR